MQNNTEVNEVNIASKAFLLRNFHEEFPKKFSLEKLLNSAIHFCGNKPHSQKTNIIFFVRNEDFVIKENLSSIKEFENFSTFSYCNLSHLLMLMTQLKEEVIFLIYENSAAPDNIYLTELSKLITLFKQCELSTQFKTLDCIEGNKNSVVMLQEKPGKFFHCKSVQNQDVIRKKYTSLHSKNEILTTPSGKSIASVKVNNESTKNKSINTFSFTLQSNGVLIGVIQYIYKTSISWLKSQKKHNHESLEDVFIISSSFIFTISLLTKFKEEHPLVKIHAPDLIAGWSPGASLFQYLSKRSKCSLLIDASIFPEIKLISSYTHS